MNSEERHYAYLGAKAAVERIFKMFPALRAEFEPAKPKPDERTAYAVKKAAKTAKAMTRKWTKRKGRPVSAATREKMRKAAKARWKAGIYNKKEVTFTAS